MRKRKESKRRSKQAPKIAVFDAASASDNGRWQTEEEQEKRRSTNRLYLDDVLQTYLHLRVQQ